MFLKLSLVHLWICVSQSRQQQNSSRTWIGFSSNIFYWNQISFILKLEKSIWQSLEVWQTPKQAITIFLNSSFYFVLRQKKRDQPSILHYFHRLITSIYYLINFFLILFFSVVEWLAPEHGLLGYGRMTILKQAASGKYTMESCKKYMCNPPASIQAQ